MLSVIDSNSVFWLHHTSLRLPKEHYAESNIIFIWDDNLFKQKNYSLKRLVFIYEMLCTLPVTIIKGDTFEVLQSLVNKKIMTWQTQDDYLLYVINALQKQGLSLSIIAEQAFVSFANDINIKRFFQYWNKIKVRAMQLNGGI